jgi:hypothetical protein
MTRNSWLRVGAVCWIAIAMFEIGTGKSFSKYGASVTRHGDPVTFWFSVLSDVFCAIVCLWCAKPISRHKVVDRDTGPDRLG